MHRTCKCGWRGLCVAVLCLVSGTDNGYAQLGIGGGFEFGTAAFVNPAFIRKPSLGIAGMLSYGLRDSRIFPSFTYLLKTIAVPVNNSFYKDLTAPATSQHFVLNLNYRTTDNPDYNLFFLGVGVSKIKPNEGFNDGNGNDITLIDTASANLYPVMQGGVKYMHRILGNSSFYVGLEANLKYIRMHSENVYYLHQATSMVKATMGGDIIFPSVQIHLDYFFDGKEE